MAKGKASSASNGATKGKGKDKGSTSKDQIHPCYLCRASFLRGGSGDQHVRLHAGRCAPEERAYEGMPPVPPTIRESAPIVPADPASAPRSVRFRDVVDHLHFLRQGGLVPVSGRMSTPLVPPAAGLVGCCVASEEHVGLILGLETAVVRMAHDSQRLVPLRYLSIDMARVRAQPAPRPAGPVPPIQPDDVGKPGTPLPSPGQQLVLFPTAAWRTSVPWDAATVPLYRSDVLAILPAASSDVVTALPGLKPLVQRYADANAADRMAAAEAEEQGRPLLWVPRATYWQLATRLCGLAIYYVVFGREVDCRGRPPVDVHGVVKQFQGLRAISLPGVPLRRTALPRNVYRSSRTSISNSLVVIRILWRHFAEFGSKPGGKRLMERFHPLPVYTLLLEDFFGTCSFMAPDLPLKAGRAKSDRRRANVIMASNAKAAAQGCQPSAGQGLFMNESGLTLSELVLQSPLCPERDTAHSINQCSHHKRGAALDTNKHLLTFAEFYRYDELTVRVVTTLAADALALLKETGNALGIRAGDVLAPERRITADREPDADMPDDACPPRKQAARCIAGEHGGYPTQFKESLVCDKAAELRQLAAGTEDQLRSLVARRSSVLALAPALPDGRWPSSVFALPPLHDDMEEASTAAAVAAADLAVEAVVVNHLRRRCASEVGGFIAEEDATFVQEQEALLSAVTAAAGGVTPIGEPISPDDVVESLRLSGDAEESTADCSFVLDPIDGTKGFLRGMQFSIGLAVTDHSLEAPVMGVMACPNLPFPEGDGAAASIPAGCVIDADDSPTAGTLFVAVQGVGAFMYPLARGPQLPAVDWFAQEASQGMATATSSLRAASTAAVGKIDRQATEVGALLPVLLPGGRRVTAGGSPDARPVVCQSFESGHADHGRIGDITSQLGAEAAESVRVDSMVKYGLLASGGADVYLRIPRPGYGEKVWDHAPGVCVLQAAGGVVTFANGAPVRFPRGQRLDSSSGGLVAASTPALHRAALQATAATTAGKL